MTATRPPRALVALIAATTLVPLSALLWLGWRLLDQDRQLQAEQARARIERAADSIIAALQRAMAVSEQRLAAGAADWPDGAVALTFRGDHVEATPRGRLAYLPAIEPLPHAAPQVFAAAEHLEFVARDPTASVAAYARLARSPDPAVRAGALIRLARNVRGSAPHQALAAYEQLAHIEGVAEGGVPVGLVAGYAKCALLEEQGRQGDLRGEAARLAADLSIGRWPIDRAVHSLYYADAARWAGLDPDAVAPTRTFAEAAAVLWDDWRAASAGLRSPPAQRAMTLNGEPIAVLWQSTATGPRALIASRGFVQSEWLRAAAVAAREQVVGVSLTDGAGRPAFTDWSRSLPSAQAGPLTATRIDAQSALPWTVTVTGDASLDAARFAPRRRLLVAGLGLLVFMALAASYFIVRAVTRELAVARLRADFVAAVSHEFRTPLTSLRQFTDMLRERPGLDEERRRLCYDAQARATERLTRLVESVLDFGRIEAGARTYELEPRDCTEFVRRLVDDFRRQPEADGYAIEFSGNGSIPIHGDGEALGRAIWNLLDNAVKYSPDRRRIRVGVTRRDGSAAIAVRDEGLGLAPHERAAIFTKFRRGEQALRRGIKGTGIGLSMAHEIVRAHGGTIDVESQPETGSTFTILLPVKE